MTISFLLEKTYRLETSFERPEKKEEHNNTSGKENI